MNIPDTADFRASVQRLPQRISLLNNHEYERLINRLYELLIVDKFDDALDLVRDEYRAIHGPSDGNAG